MTDAKTVPVPATELTELSKRLGYARGLLRGWMTHDADNLELCRVMTKRFLEEDGHD